MKRVEILGGPQDGNVLTVDDHITTVTVTVHTDTYIRHYVMKIEYAITIGLIARWNENNYKTISEITT
jgi:hypothetical protein